MDDNTALTRSFRETVAERARLDPAFRDALIEEAQYEENLVAATIAPKGILWGLALSIPLWGALVYALTSVTWNVIWAALWGALP